MNSPQVIVPDDIDFARYMRESEPKAKMRPATAFRKQVHQLAMPRPEQDNRTKMPFNGCWLNFRPGEMSMWGGFNNSGKSLLQGQVMVSLAARNFRVAIASFEMAPARTLLRMVRQHCGKREPTAMDIDDFLERYGQLIWFYNQQGNVSPERMLAVARYCVAELGIEHIAIDSMMKCVRGEDDYNGQKDLVNDLCCLSQDSNLHTHLVHHLKKDDDERMPTRMDMRGSAAISDLVDNVLLLWRNKAKERHCQMQSDRYRADDPDAILICDKQRNGDWEGRVKLWFDTNGARYFDHKKKSALD
jgi:twinkle protein